MSRQTRQTRILSLIRQGVPDPAIRASTGATQQLIDIIRESLRAEPGKPHDRRKQP